MNVLVSIGSMPAALDRREMADPRVPESHLGLVRSLADAGLDLHVLLWAHADAAPVLDSVRRPEAVRKLLRVFGAEDYRAWLAARTPGEYDAYVLAAETSGWIPALPAGSSPLPEAPEPGDAAGISFHAAACPEAVIRHADPDAAVAAVARVPSGGAARKRAEKGGANLLAAILPSGGAVMYGSLDGVPYILESVGKAFRTGSAQP